MGTQVTFDIKAKLFLDVRTEIIWDQMERFFMHGAIFNGVDSPGGCTAIGF
jgi:hypothetical protein